MSDGHERHVASVFVFPNGMVAVCDQFGEQMPELQGRWSEKRADILAACAGRNVEWFGERPSYADTNIVPSTDPWNAL